MIEIQKEKILGLDANLYKNIPLNNIIFFDIETTGFDKEKASVILISGGWFDENNKFIIKQYFAESLDEEVKLLESFKKDISKFPTWCSYNGKAFDEPFINKRMDINNINFIPPQNHIDLYRLIRPYYKQLGIERCNLKSVEKYLGIDRQDQIDGGVCVELYYEFLMNKDIKLRELIMLHNYEDVLNLPVIFKLTYDIKKDKNLKREDCITKRQLDYLRYLLRKNKITINSDLKMISKKAASRIIDSILRREIDICKFNDIINDSY
ncbi:ribonuclease H-like domain-containing protein [Clostridium novyi]|uniref:ribonuclease H-like domain-containing protein n=1 Tax=Clostridium novyi TaxID=1542 RepID=UPI0004D56CFB|nr:ribonuclease H-like domain-containing protein [Clostridium novyi]KEI13807.1 DNA polymerase [Clostridium novyi B str. NCTC 9691]